MPTKLLLSILAEAVSSSVDDNLVVAALEADGFAGRMRCCGSESEHVGFSDEFNGNGDV